MVTRVWMRVSVAKTSFATLWKVAYVSTVTEVSAKLFIFKNGKYSSIWSDEFISECLGENCDVQSTERITQDNDPQRGSSTYVFGMILIIMIVCGFFGFLYYHRRKVSNLKSVISHLDPVRYIADGGSEGKYRDPHD